MLNKLIKLQLLTLLTFIAVVTGNVPYRIGKIEDHE